MYSNLALIVDVYMYNTHFSANYQVDVSVLSLEAIRIHVNQLSHCIFIRLHIVGDFHQWVGEPHKSSIYRQSRTTMFSHLG